MARRALRIGLRSCLLYHCFRPILAVLQSRVQLWPLLTDLRSFRSPTCDCHPRSIQEGYKEGIKKALCFFLNCPSQKGPVELNR